MRVKWWEIVVPLLLLGIVVVWFFLPAVANGPPSLRLACLSNVWQIGMSMIMYADDHDGRYPPSFGGLLKEQYLGSERIFICPSSEDRFPHDFPEDVTKADLTVLDSVAQWGSYVMVKGLTHGGSGGIIILYEKPGNHREKGRHCCFADGHVKWLTEEEFHKHIRAQEAKVRERSRLKP